MKSTVTITMDTEILLDLRKERLNLSGIINSLLKEYVQNSQEKNKKDVKYLLIDGLKKRIAELEKEKKEMRLKKEENKTKPKVVITGGT